MTAAGEYGRVRLFGLQIGVEEAIDFSAGDFIGRIS